MTGGTLVLSLASWGAISLQGYLLLFLFFARRVEGSQPQRTDPVPVPTISYHGARASATTVTQCTSPVYNFALRGVDVVAYFSLEEEDAAVLGSMEFASTCNGYRFLFASAGNKALFEDNPWAYIPKYGGFCGIGIAEEDYWNKLNLGPPSDPDVWLITSDHQLFLFRLDGARAAFEQDVLGNTEDGDTRWRGWFGDDVRDYPLDTDCFCTTHDSSSTDSASSTTTVCDCGTWDC